MLACEMSVPMSASQPRIEFDPGLPISAHADQIAAHAVEIEEGLVDPRRMIQIGIRSPVQREVWDWTIGKGVTIDWEKLE